MTISAWIGLSAIILFIFGGAIVLVFTDFFETPGKILVILIALVFCVGAYVGFRWYYTSTASGIRALTDERSNLSNGLDRTINVYTANGELLAHYEGKIDLEMDQDYIKFDWEGKRYIYYNCFVETIANLP